MSHIYRIYCETDEVDGPRLRFSAHTVRVPEDEQDDAVRFFEVHEWHELRLR